MKQFDILVAGGRLRGRGENSFDIGIREGRIHAIEPKLSRESDLTVEANGNLVTESFANPHLHLDKVFTLAMLDDQAMQDYHGDSMGKAMKAIERAAKVKETYNRAWIIDNVRRAVRWAARNGNTHIRAFADVDSKSTGENLAATE